MSETAVEQPAATQQQPGAEGATTPTETSTPTEKPRADPPEWAIRRFGELTAAKKAADERAAAAERRAAELEQRLAAPPQQQQEGQTQQQTQVHPNVVELARTMALQEAETIVNQRSMAKRIASIEEAGRKEFGGEFDRSIQNLQIAGIGSPEFLEALTSMPNPEKVVRFLGDAVNIEEAMRISGLPPVQMAIEMAKLAPKAVQAYTKAISSAPAPIAPIEGTGRAEGAEPDPKADPKAWIAWRNQTARRK
ncbi:hypothetical protein WKR98_13310 [Pigmentiphaga sp. YJ18]|uniref:hypothetical protein n=1 Tax=Pigmentiphaga sp. YJ18 TaxID=3134907 RepID=UPI00311046B7